MTDSAKKLGHELRKSLLEEENNEDVLRESRRLDSTQESRASILLLIYARERHVVDALVKAFEHYKPSTNVVVRWIPSLPIEMEEVSSSPLKVVPIDEALQTSHVRMK
jgi:hypothetical protein